VVECNIVTGYDIKYSCVIQSVVTECCLRMRYDAIHATRWPLESVVFPRVTIMTWSHRRRHWVRVTHRGHALVSVAPVVKDRVLALPEGTLQHNTKTTSARTNRLVWEFYWHLQRCGSTSNAGFYIVDVMLDYRRLLIIIWAPFVDDVNMFSHVCDCQWSCWAQTYLKMIHIE